MTMTDEELCAEPLAARTAVLTSSVCFKCSDHGPPDIMMLCRMWKEMISGSF
jgi:hypothetical protein